MTPQKKAIELVEKYRKLEFQIGGQYDGYLQIQMHDAKDCALIAVDEILNARPLDPNYVDWDDCGASHQYWYEAQKEEALEFWNNVKSELQSL